MRAAVLHFDDSLTVQEALAARVRTGGGRTLDLRDLGPRLRLWTRPADFETLRVRLAAGLPGGDGPTLAFCGSGDFHHATPLLLERALEAAGRPTVTLVHFDNHPDWVRYANGVHCGSWVARAARIPQVAKVVTVGVCSSDILRPRRADPDLLAAQSQEIYAYRAPDGGRSVTLGGREWPTIEAMGEAAFAAHLMSRIEAEAVYVSIDKDVLRADDAATNWDQGRMGLTFLKTLLATLMTRHRLIGADIVGDWSRPIYGGGPLARFLKAGEAWLDQPRSPPDMAAVAANEHVNLELLDLIVGAAEPAANPLESAA